MSGHKEECFVGGDSEIWKRHVIPTSPFSKCGLCIQMMKAKHFVRRLWFCFVLFLNSRKIKVVLLLHPVPAMAWSQLKKAGSPRILMIPIMVTLTFMTTSMTAGTGQCILKLVLLQNMDFNPGLPSVQSKR